MNTKLTSVERTDPYPRSWRREHTAVRTLVDALMGKMGKFRASCAIKVSIGDRSLTFFLFLRSFLHCNCDNGYEGDHCEYKLGKAPATVTATDESDEGGSKSLSSVEAFFLSVFIISSVVIAAYYGRKLMNKKAVEAQVMNDLKLSHEQNNASVTVADNEDKEIV